jgi:RND family efflux transporter MFP subunit
MKLPRWTGRVAVGAVVGLAAWVVFVHPDWLKSTAHEEEPEKVETEVAVRLTKVLRTTLHRTIEAYGTVLPEPASESAPSASARVASPVAGIVAVCSAVEGRPITKGQLLFQLDDRVARAEEEKSQAAVERAKVAVAFAEKFLDRQNRLMADEATAPRKVEEADLQVASARGELGAAERVVSAAKTARSLLSITAPLSGTITHVRVNPGEAVDPNATLAEVVDLDRLVVQAIVPTRDAGPLRLGQPVEIFSEASSAADTSVIVAGKLGFIALDVDPKSDSIVVRVSLPPKGVLRVGAYVRVRIVVEERVEQLAVPKECVVVDTDGKSVISVVEGSRATQKLVKTGVRDGDLVEIEAEGLKEGTLVVTSGAYGLPKETRVRILEK